MTPLSYGQPVSFTLPDRARPSSYSLPALPSGEYVRTVGGRVGYDDRDPEVIALEREYTVFDTFPAELKRAIHEAVCPVPVMRVAMIYCQRGPDVAIDWVEAGNKLSLAHAMQHGAPAHKPLKANW